MQATPQLPADATPASSQHGYSITHQGPNNALVVTGQVVALVSGGFQIQGGPQLGYFDVYTNSSTVYTGAKPYIGESVVAAGTGTPQTSLAATSVGQLATAAGSVTVVFSGGFQMVAGRLGNMYVYTTSTTQVVGSNPYVGEAVTVQGTGTPGQSMTAVVVANGSSSPTPSPAPTGSPSTTPSPGPSPSFTPPPTTGFMQSTFGKIAAFQVFDEFGSNEISASQAEADNSRYAAVWGPRTDNVTAWTYQNSALQGGYYNPMQTDASSAAWGYIGHSISWWQTNHPDWILYACTSSNAPTTTPAYIPGLTYNVPLDIHNPAAVTYQIDLMANYAHQMGYRALSIDEATFWQAGEGVSGGFGCGIYEGSTFVRRYNSATDPAYVADVIAWVKQAHSILTTDPTISTYHLKLIVNHPAESLNANETAFLANVDADVNENGYSFYGRPVQSSAVVFNEVTAWTQYAQQHGIAVLTIDNWGTATMGNPQLDYTVASYLISNEQAEALWAGPSSGYGAEQWHSQYSTAVGVPCGEYYSAGDPKNPSIYYRRFTNAIVVVNAGSGTTNEVAYLPTGHTYTDLFGRSVSSALTIDSNDGYVLLTSNGCH